MYLIRNLFLGINDYSYIVYCWEFFFVFYSGSEALKSTFFPQKADIFTFHISKTEQPKIKQPGPFDSTINRRKVLFQCSSSGYCCEGKAEEPRQCSEVTRQKDVWRKQMARRQDEVGGWTSAKSARVGSAPEGARESVSSLWVRSFSAAGDEPLLQVAVDFKAVVPGICDHNVSVRGESQSLRSVQRVGWRVDVGQEGAAAIKHLTEVSMIMILVSTRGLICLL